MIFFNHSLITFIIIIVIAISANSEKNEAIENCKEILKQLKFENNTNDYSKIKPTDELIIMNNRLFEGFKTFLADYLNSKQWTCFKTLIQNKRDNPFSKFCEFKNLKKYFGNP